jgi:FKBP-type peptidyl-prolyl cis-trans isomerase (trigger factor)
LTNRHSSAILTLVKTEVERLPKNTIKIEITVPAEDVKKTYEEVVGEMCQNVEVAGFRKGKAPRALAEKQLNPKTVENHALEHLLNQAVSAAIKEHLLKPIANPKVEIRQYAPDKDLIFTARLAEKPKIELGDYPKTLKEFRPKKAASPLLYGPDGQPTTGRNEKKETVQVEELLDALLTQVVLEIPDLLVEEEVNRMLSRLVDQTARVGLTIEEYLKSQNKTTEQLRQEYRQQAEQTLKYEFLLAELGTLEKIKVEEKEIEDMIAAAPDEKTREQFKQPASRLYIASVLRNNKTIRRLIEIAEGDK